MPLRSSSPSTSRPSKQAILIVAQVYLEKGGRLVRVGGCVPGLLSDLCGRGTG
jgi:hypothetical protein